MPSAVTTTSGRNHRPTRSARDCSDNGLSRASSTTASKRSISRAVPGAVAAIWNVASNDAEPARTRSPGRRTTANGSPLTAASDTNPTPSRITPSTAISSPGCTSTTSPGFTSTTGAVRVRPASSTNRQTHSRSPHARELASAAARERAPITRPSVYTTSRTDTTSK